MTKTTFWEGMGLGVLAGAAIGIVVAAKRPDAMRDMRRAARRTACKVDQFKDGLADTMGL